MDIPDGDTAIRWERTLRTAGHFTLWGDPDRFLVYVVAVAAVENPIG